MLLMSVMMHCEAPDHPCSDSGWACCQTKSDHPCSDSAGPVAKLNQMGQCTCYLKKSGGPPHHQISAILSVLQKEGCMDHPAEITDEVKKSNALNY